MNTWHDLLCFVAATIVLMAVLMLATEIVYVVRQWWRWRKLDRRHR